MMLVWGLYYPNRFHWGFSTMIRDAQFMPSGPAWSEAVWKVSQPWGSLADSPVPPSADRVLSAWVVTSHFSKGIESTKRGLRFPRITYIDGVMSHLEMGFDVLRGLGHQNLFFTTWGRSHWEKWQNPLDNSVSRLTHLPSGISLQVVLLVDESYLPRFHSWDSTSFFWGVAPWFHSWPWFHTNC